MRDARGWSLLALLPAGCFLAEISTVVPSGPELWEAPVLAASSARAIRCTRLRCSDLNRADFCGEMIQLRLDGVQPLGVQLDGPNQVLQQIFDVIEATLDGQHGSVTFPVAIVPGFGRCFGF